MIEKNTKEFLYKLIEIMGDNNVIVVRYKQYNYHTPAIIKKGDEYQVYTCIYSQFDKYETIDELIDYFYKFIADDEYYFEITSTEEFEKLRLRCLICDVKARHNTADENDNFTLIKREVETYGGTYVLTPSNKVQFLIGACTSDEDYYYITLEQKNGQELSVGLEFHTCVGGFIPLIDKLSEDEYKRVQNYIINETIETLDPVTLRPGHEVVMERLKKEFDDTTEYVLFTPIYLIRDGENERIKE